ncbi:MAG: hypothetical protein KGZ51_01555, partial [Erysipelothrix sp.]|nr:hypothetical protein [Erysipelothrix sp.]
MDWKVKLDKFLFEWEYMEDTIGILVCGSFITGEPSAHSDLDVHIILSNDVDYRERGNRIIDGLLIEYFANPPKQISKYFEEDYREICPMSQTQFITGRILLDKTGVVQELKNKAKEMLENRYQEIDSKISELNKYAIWDMLDDLQDALESGRKDFNLIYYCNLDKLLSLYMRLIKYPYNYKSILGNITSELTRSKYLLEELPDKRISEIITNCITSDENADKLFNYE